MFDAHIHVGYYPREGYEELFYYSPRRVAGLLSRCGVGEFIVSSTDVQAGVTGVDILREAREMRRVAGTRAHQFYWISGRSYDPKLAFLETGLFEGLKFHELETPWFKERREELDRIVGIAESRGLAVMFHASAVDGCRPMELKELAETHPMVRFNFAHCCPEDEIFEAMSVCPNVFTDTAMVRDYSIFAGVDMSIRQRILFGSDFPAYQSKGMTYRVSDAYRRKMDAYVDCFGEDNAERVFKMYLGKINNQHERS